MDNIYQSVWLYVLNHAYAFLFGGMLLGGETFFLPAMYFAVVGPLNAYIVLGLATLATLISDSIWYTLGRFVSLPQLLAYKFFKRRENSILQMHEVFGRHGFKLLYLSKFVYGTRIAAQVLSGTVRMPFDRYLIVNLAGVVSYLGVISLAALAAQEGLASFEKTLRYGYVSIGIFIVIVAIIHLIFKKWLGKNFAPLSQPGTKSELSEK